MAIVRAIVRNTMAEVCVFWEFRR